MKRSQEEENRAPCDCTYASCVLMVPWEHPGRLSAQLVCTHSSVVRPHESEENVDFYLNDAASRPVADSSKLELKIEDHFWSRKEFGLQLRYENREQIKQKQATTIKWSSGGVSPYPKVLGRDAELTASKVALFLPSIVFSDQQLMYVRIDSGYSLDVMPKSWQCVRMSPWVHTHRHLNWPPRFFRDFLVPRALFIDFHSGLILSNPKTLAQTNQGIERNGKQLNT
ncbi:hypothetical protein PIB30_070335 [Stylosanthes scabra]|uniref:Uncharacterized protein n=1 Tax=Stylosanthes scabra TaxID=79078 RepID=A0ABU6TNX8_9FABA|nr:hypothetical protein [Stylosanthes scabra]